MGKYKGAKLKKKESKCTLEILGKVGEYWGSLESRRGKGGHAGKLGKVDRALTHFLNLQEFKVCIKKNQ